MADWPVTLTIGPWTATGNVPENWQPRLLRFLAEKQAEQLARGESVSSDIADYMLMIDTRAVKDWHKAQLDADGTVIKDAYEEASDSVQTSAESALGVVLS